MPGIVIASQGTGRMPRTGPGRAGAAAAIDVDAQTAITRTALEMKRDAQIHVRRVICSDGTCAYQTALVMGIVLDIPMGEIRRDARLDEGRPGEDELLALVRHLDAIMDHGHGLLDSNKVGLLVIGHPRGLNNLSRHFRHPSDLPPGGYRLLGF